MIQCFVWSVCIGRALEDFKMSLTFNLVWLFFSSRGMPFVIYAIINPRVSNCNAALFLFEHVIFQMPSLYYAPGQMCDLIRKGFFHSVIALYELFRHVFMASTNSKIGLVFFLLSGIRTFPWVLIAGFVSDLCVSVLLNLWLCVLLCITVGKYAAWKFHVSTCKYGLGTWKKIKMCPGHYV